MSLHKSAKCIFRKNLFINTFCETDCIHRRHLVKMIDRVTDKAEKHLHSNKFMRAEDVMPEFFKIKKDGHLVF